MAYITNANDIRGRIAQYAQSKVLWVDTEIADFLTRNPRLSLIQLLDHPNDETGERVSILDVLDQPELADVFINEIMLNPAIEKVFHHASYDLKFLGKSKAKNVTCTLEMAKKIPYYILPLPNLSLKTLAEALCNGAKVDKSQQVSDWGQRPLTEIQLNYAKMDPVYLAMVHHQLQLKAPSDPEPDAEEVTALAERYLELKQQLQVLNSEFEHIETRLKTAMQAQNLTETPDLKLTQSKRTTLKVAFDHLAKVAQLHEMHLDFPITLTQKLQKQMADIIHQLSIQEETSTSWRLSIKQQDESQPSNADF